MSQHLPSFTIIGGGFSGLSAAYDLARAGHQVTVLEADRYVGGLAGAFDTAGERLDRFYHHWFTNDQEVMGLIKDTGLADDVVVQPTNTGLYYAGHFFKLSTPLDLLKFTALPFIDRIRLGLLTLRARHVKDWKELENQTAAEWLRKLGGENVFRVVWEPLLAGKFGPYADKVSAVWFWNKLKLRGGSRGKGGEERLVYMKGSFARLAEATATGIEKAGGKVICEAPVTQVTPLDNGRWQVSGPWGSVESDKVIATTALPLVADMVENWATPEYLASLRRIDYLANVCLVLQLDRSLSSTYWLNVNDPSFPFVGIIEHTNFENASSYAGNHIVYLSKYLPHTDALYTMSPQEVLDFSLPYIQKMFPKFDRSWIQKFDVWKARWSQPVVEKHYSSLIPSQDGPREGFHLCSMAQIYPEDRGTNYAIREGRKIAAKFIA
ncbi:FAD-dependent oxidoreductase [Acetobacter lambici]|uniref:NAD(P)/FAD-dependent oxidoreductase n=1 Tax=Acetobacter lambici TaxID=1332824 RepID=A0ABT1EW39_9PROT|nr:NAD(P)/FAD-dependent oxidoreductase [Acetobacter lambici]MCP1241183.1 NAD(P)/FAD-dependent oxidoreductase [Acetobacter lambici]MCP1257145.1 NAD(P)/FAD-dependent oxidoreductase [Acetobacter lambici]NHO55638.1 FAD-dependent oxidoreductase [Acetobacter lambici]